MCYEKENEDIHNKIIVYLSDIEEKLLLINKLPLPIEIKIRIKNEWIKTEITLEYIETEIDFNWKQEEMNTEYEIRIDRMNLGYRDYIREYDSDYYLSE